MDDDDERDWIWVMYVRRAGGGNVKTGRRNPGSGKGGSGAERLLSLCGGIGTDEGEE